MKYKYKRADKYVYINKDQEGADTITIRLPKPPPLEEIEGYGLPPEEQIFIRPEMPTKLKYLDEKRYSDVDDYWNDIKGNYSYYKSDLQFIKEHWRRRKHGHWVFINGKPTFINGWHYFYLTAYEMDTEGGGLNPQYRDRDRKFFVWVHSSYLDPDCMGIVYPKMRREGATAKAVAVMFEVMTRLKTTNKVAGIQSMTESDAQTDVWNQFVIPAWDGLPFYFIPRHNPKARTKGIEFRRGAKQPKEAKKYLKGRISFKGAAKKEYDGAKVIFYIGDEEAKTTEENILGRWQTVSKAMSLGGGGQIIGFSFHISTTSQEKKKKTTLMKDAEAMKNWKTLCERSQYGTRSATGRTATGLYTGFIPSYEGLEGKIDYYGNSVINTPKSPVKSNTRGADGEYKMITEGAKDWIDKVLQSKLDEEDYEGWSEEIRMLPTKYKDVFTLSSDNCVYNLVKLNTRLNGLNINRPAIMYGDFKWERRGYGLWDTNDIRKLPTIGQVVTGEYRVIFVPSEDANANWAVSYLFEDERMSNRIEWSDELELYVPGNQTKFASGADPVKFAGNTTTRHASEACMLFYRKFDSSMDNPMIDPTLINPATKDFFNTSDRLCAMYLKRPRSKNEYLESWLKACIYYGSTTYPEIVIPDVWDWFGETRGFDGYLYHQIDRISGKRDLKPGEHLHTKLAIEMANEIGFWVETNVDREVFESVIEQVRNVGMGYSPNDNDAYSALGMCLLCLKKSELFDNEEDSGIIIADNTLQKLMGFGAMR